MSAFIRSVAVGHVFHRVSLSPVALSAGKWPNIRLPSLWRFRQLSTEPDKSSDSKFARKSREANSKAEKSDESDESAEYRFRIASVSRGKELMIRLMGLATETDGDASCISILLRAGMSGHFALAPSADKLAKHSHLNFHRDDGAVLSYVDPRRFGRWELTDQWSPDRSPCPVLEFGRFRQHIASQLHLKAFSASICEVLLDQRFFNGIGNYLRAEILYRAGISPFAPACSVLEPELTVESSRFGETPTQLPSFEELLATSKHFTPTNDACTIDASSSSSSSSSSKEDIINPLVDLECSSSSCSSTSLSTSTALSIGSSSAPRKCGWKGILELCHRLPVEVITQGFWYKDDPVGSIANSGQSTFNDWLQCYGKLLSAKDSKGRTIWYSSTQISAKRRKSKAASRKRPFQKTKRVSKEPANEEAILEESSSAKRRKSNAASRKRPFQKTKRVPKEPANGEAILDKSSISSSIRLRPRKRRATRAEAGV